MDHEVKLPFDLASDFELDCVCYARPQLYFNCSFRRSVAHEPIECSVVYYTGSAFDDFDLNLHGHMEKAGFKMLYEPSGKKLGISSVALFLTSLVGSHLREVVPCFIHGNATPTIHHEYY